MKAILKMVYLRVWANNSLLMVITISVSFTKVNVMVVELSNLPTAMNMKVNGAIMIKTDMVSSNRNINLLRQALNLNQCIKETFKMDSSMEKGILLLKMDLVMRETLLSVFVMAMESLKFQSMILLMSISKMMVLKFTMVNLKTICCTVMQKPPILME
jgi:hypothetical protein